MKKDYFLLIILFIFLATPLIIKAQMSVSVFPEKFDLELSKGDKINDQIKISNLGRDTLGVNVRAMDFSTKGEKGEMIFEDEGDPSYSLSQWLDVKTKNFNLSSGEFKAIDFTLSIPEIAETGGHYGALFFETQVLKDKNNPTAVNIISKVGSIFLIKIKGENKYPALDKQFEIVELKAPQFIENGQINLDFRLKNNDPVHIRVGGEVLIYNIFGGLKEKIKIDDQTILPKQIRFFEAKTASQNFFDRFFIGSYKAEIVLSSQTWREKIGNDRQIVKTINFFVLPWKIFIPPYFYNPIVFK